jgi:undecaprenyl diphosphate synthase
MKTPQHVAIIMDGNRRWARQHGLQILAGHETAGKKTILALVKKCLDLNIPYLTLWVWSTENWQRNKKEVEGILGLFLQLFEEQAAKLNRLGARIKTIGNLRRFSEDIQKGLNKWKRKTQRNKELVLTLALNYGGRDEIIRAIKKLQNSKTPKDKLTEKKFSQYLDTADMPDPDLIIRTGGEKRLSGFLLWQSEYSELYFTETLMPDFGPEELARAIEEYSQRQRRFGK